MSRFKGLELIFNEIMEDSPLGREKLERLWADLTIETQMDILAELVERDMHLTPVQLEAIYPKSHSVVQQLAIRHTPLDPENELLDSVLHDAIFSNLDTLVSNSRWASNHLDEYNRIEDYQDDFLDSSYYRKLAILEGANAPDGITFADCIIQLKDNGESDEHITEFIKQYTCNEKAIESHRYEHYTPDCEPFYLERIERLWGLAALLPIEQGKLLAQKLPVEISSQAKIDQDFFEGLNPELLFELLKRSDIELIDLRRKILFDIEYTKNTDLLHACVYQNFSCTDHKLALLFHNIESGEREYFARLLFLTHADYLTPQQIKVIGWYFNDQADEPDEWPVTAALRNLANSVTRQVSDDFEEYYKSSDDLDLLDLLFDQVTWKGDSSNMMKFLKPLTEQFDIQNPWDLYIAVKEAMPSKSADELCREAAFDEGEARFSAKALLGGGKKMPFSRYQIYHLFYVRELTAEDAFRVVVDTLQQYPKREKVLFDQLFDEKRGEVTRFAGLRQYHEMVELLLQWYQAKPDNK